MSRINLTEQERKKRKANEIFIKSLRIQRQKQREFREHKKELKININKMIEVRDNIIFEVNNILKRKVPLEIEKEILKFIGVNNYYNFYNIIK